MTREPSAAQTKPASDKGKKAVDDGPDISLCDEGPLSRREREGGDYDDDNEPHVRWRCDHCRYLQPPKVNRVANWIFEVPRNTEAVRLSNGDSQLFLERSN